MTIQNKASATSLLALEIVFKENYLAFFDLVCAARDRQYVMFDKYQILTDLTLVERFNKDGTVNIHETVRDVILDRVEGSDFEMVIRGSSNE